MEYKWMLKKNSVDIDSLSKKSGISKILVTLLVNRGIRDIAEIKQFINPYLSDLYDPFLMKDMDKGTDIIVNAIKNNMRILVYGDYDCDGVTSTAILYKALKRCKADVSYHVPDRVTEGYGVNIDTVIKMKNSGIDLIVTCDNGISAKEEVKKAKELGMQFVISDHHEIPYIEGENGNKRFFVPDADAVIDPKQKECNYPFKYLCGAGIAFKIAGVLYKKMNIPVEECIDFLELAALGTVCDIVELTSENRLIVKFGLEKLNNTKNIGLKALIDSTNLTGKEITSGHIGFIIGPCINATGRLDKADSAVELLISDNPFKVSDLSKKLVELNKQRQEMCDNCVERVTDLILNNEEIKNKRVYVIYVDSIHESIAGIVAGKIKDRFYRPVIVFTKTADKGIAKGSARSIENYNMFQELSKCKEMLLKFGGHPMAAGMSMYEKDIDKLSDKLNCVCTLTDDDLIPKIRIDAHVPINSLSFDVISELNLLEPFGNSNPKPYFAEKNIDIIRVYTIGKGKNHLKFFCKIPETGIKIDAIMFNEAEKFNNMIINKYGSEKLNNVMNNSARIKMDMIFYPEINKYNGNKSIQLIVKDFRLSKDQ